MTYIWAAALTLLNLAWLVLLVVGLPGTWLILASCAGLSWWLHRGAPPEATWLIAPTTLAILAGFAIAGEIIEFWAGAEGARRFGGTRRGALGAVLGAILGGLLSTFLIPLPVVGTILGAALGASVGALAFELHGGRDVEASLRSGVGAGLGRLAGTVGKLIVGVAMWIVAAVAAFF